MNEEVSKLNKERSLRFDHDPPIKRINTNHGAIHTFKGSP